MQDTKITAIAFDFGTKNIGIAVGQNLTGGAQEIQPIKARDGIPNWDEVAAIIEQWQPNIAVVGLPLNMDGTEQELTRRARKFGNRIHARYKLPVHFEDERLSTFEAKEIAQRAGHKNNYAQAPVDSIAARVILEDYWNNNA